MRLTASLFAMTLGAVLVFSPAWVAGPRAQSPSTARVIRASANVRASASPTSPIIMALGAGSEVEVVSVEADWVKVALPADAQGITRKGFISKAVVELAAAPVAARTPAPAHQPETRNLEQVAQTEPAPVPALPPSSDGRVVVAVLDFDHSTLRPWWQGYWDVGRGISALLVDEMVNGGTFRVLERKQLAAVFGEQGLANSTRANPDAKYVAELRRIFGAQYLVIGEVTWFGGADEKKRIWTGFLEQYGGFSVRKQKAKVELAVRLVSTSTAEVGASVVVPGVSERRDVIIRGLNDRAISNVSFTSGEFRSTLLGEATSRAVQGVARELTKKRSNLTH